MNIAQVNLRQAVLENVSDSTLNDLRDTIVDAVGSGEDKILPGLGVLFEVLWKESTLAQQGELLQRLHGGIQNP